MSSSVDYTDGVATCPDCGEENDVTVIVEQDNRTCETSRCISGVATCSECGAKLTMDDVE